MKTKISLFFLVLSASVASYAYPARYSIKGKCYSIPENTAYYTAYFLGSAVGSSGYDCDNAAEILDSICEHRAKEQGLTGSSVYKDLWVLGKSASAAGGYSFDTRRSRVLFGLLYNANGYSVSSYRSVSKFTNVQPVPLDAREGKDCKLNKKYPQEDEPSIVDAGLMG